MSPVVLFIFRSRARGFMSGYWGRMGGVIGGHDEKSWAYFNLTLKNVAKWCFLMKPFLEMVINKVHMSQKIVCRKF